MSSLVLATTVQSPGGLWRHVSDLALGMAERDWDVRLCLPRQAAELRERATEAGLALMIRPRFSGAKNSWTGVVPSTTPRNRFVSA